MSTIESGVEAATAPREAKHKSLLREVVETILLTVAIYVIVNAATGRFRIQGASMEPTLHSGQFVITNKVAYKIGQPRRGDIIVFIAPRTAQEEDYIKRIIGLPGETVRVEARKVYVNGQMIEEPYIADAPQYSSTWKVGPDEYFVLGDNRNHSNDSHDWGLLKRDAILGKAWLIYWPPEFWGGVPNYSAYSLASTP
ncbi:MAG: signal peptidase I [Chloroflexi bacterium]|nr:signal peptidase I [Chloroflexota bacterium]MBI3760587.1 signal peptidase I [Chloroflexota bacterium]